MSDAITKKLDALLEAEAKKKDTHRVLLAVQGHDLDYRGVAGSISPKDPFFIASITKMMTATLVMQLVEKGTVDLDDPISKYLAESEIQGIHVYKGHDYSSQIKIHELIHQTSGLPDYFEEDLYKQVQKGEDSSQPLSLTDVLNKARKLPPKFAPSSKAGTKSYYSDTNYQILGAIVETCTNSSIADVMDRKIFQPLGLSKNTYVFRNDNTQKKEPMPFCHRDEPVIIPNIMASFGPDGGVVSTLDDMLIFLRAYFDGKLFDKAYHVRMQSQWNSVFNFMIGYGYGVMRFQIPRWMTLYCFPQPPPLVGHSGANCAFAFYCPERDVFLVGSFNQIEQQSRPFPFMLQVLECLK